MFIDIKKAHLYAPMVGDEYVELPPERAQEGMCAKLVYTLYGMRMAAANWERVYTATLRGREGGTLHARPCRGNLQRVAKPGIP